MDPWTIVGIVLGVTAAVAMIIWVSILLAKSESFRKDFGRTFLCGVKKLIFKDGYQSKKSSKPTRKRK